MGTVLTFKSTNAQKWAVRRKRLFVESCISECNHCSMPHYCQISLLQLLYLRPCLRPETYSVQKTQTRMQSLTYLTCIKVQSQISTAFCVKKVCYPFLLDCCWNDWISSAKFHRARVNVYFTFYLFTGLRRSFLTLKKQNML